MTVSSAGVLRGLLKLSCCLVGFGLVMVGIRLPYLFILLAFGVAYSKARRVVGSAWSHGSARLSTILDCVYANMMGQDGLILGTTTLMQRPSLKEGLSALCSKSMDAETAVYLFLLAMGGRKWAGDRIIRIRQFTHLLTCAPTGRGKGISVLIPNLRSYRGSCVVTDPKGELYTLTAWIRYHVFNHRIIRLDPFGVCGPDAPASDRWNFFDGIDDKAPDFLDQCRDRADMIVIQTGKENDPFWNESARTVLTAFIAYVCACEDNPEHRTMDTVRDLISSRITFAKSIELMQQVESHNGVIKRLGHSLTWFESKTLAGVLANVQRFTEAFDSPPVAANLTSSTFDPMWLRTGRVTIYLCLPHDKLSTLAPLMRVWIGTILRAITRGTPSEKNPVLFLLDEAAHLGKIAVLEQAVTLMRGFGIRLWFFFQSLQQVEECFGDKAKTILDNIDTQQYFAFNNFDNAEAISKKVGDTTISIVSHGENSGRSRSTGGSGQESGSVSSGTNSNRSDTGRRLFKPEELLVLPEDVGLVFHRNMPVILVRLLKYFEHPSFRNRGTGQQPGLGKIATEKAVGLLLASLVFAAIAASLSLSESTPYLTPTLSPHTVRQAVHSKQALPRGQQRRSVPPAPSGWQFTQ